MKLRLYTFTIVLIIIFSGYSYSQNNDKYLRQDIIPLYDSLLHPPLNCGEAFSYTEYDSLKNKFEIAGILKDQFNLIFRLKEEYETETSKSELEYFTMPGVPEGPEIPGSRPPQNGSFPPGGIDNRPEGLQEIMEDINKANILMDKIIVHTEKYKNEIKKSVSNLNQELKSTLQNDYSGRVKISNEFLSEQNSEFDKYFTFFKNNVKKIKEIVSKYNYGKYLNFRPLRIDLLRLQTAAINNLSFLITITKEFSLTGAKFYSEELKIKQ